VLSHLVVGPATGRWCAEAQEQREPVLRVGLGRQFGVAVEELPQLDAVAQGRVPVSGVAGQAGPFAAGEDLLAPPVDGVGVVGVERQGPGTGVDADVEVVERSGVREPLPRLHAARAEQLRIVHLLVSLRRGYRFPELV
jgi:hypothetical protein